MVDEESIVWLCVVADHHMRRYIPDSASGVVSSFLSILFLKVLLKNKCLKLSGTCTKVYVYGRSDEQHIIHS